MEERLFLEINLNFMKSKMLMHRVVLGQILLILIILMERCDGGNPTLNLNVVWPNRAIAKII